MKDYFVGKLRDDSVYIDNMIKGGLEALPPAVLTCAITGGIHGSESNPNLPEKIDDQVQSIIDAYNAGAVMVHIHVRNPEKLGEMTPYVEGYKEINRKVRDACPDIIINNTAMGGRFVLPDGSFSPYSLTSLGAHPEVISFDMANIYEVMNLRRRPEDGGGRYERVLHYISPPNDCMEILKLMEEGEAKPEFEFFDVAGIKLLREVIRRREKEGKEIAKPYWCSVLFGGNGTLPSVKQIIQVAEMLPPEVMLQVIGIGVAQPALTTAGLILGHNIRVGLEDNVFYKKGVLAESNAQLVERAVRTAKEIGRRLATPAEAREMMGLGAPRKYD
ncbi:MAG: 3-keto-5-aminohexanoate cleavage protein [Lachnospiraceae bacterium]|nr:3-keto-5-aminohexanoate cleavage protein [Lachnospiraceae bacterium]